MDLKEIGCEGEDWIHLAQDKEPVKTVMYVRYRSLLQDKTTLASQDLCFMAFPIVSTLSIM
jgi:hypothetical protein